MGLNYLKPTWITRFLLGVLPKGFYSQEESDDDCDVDEGAEDGRDVYQALLGAIADDMNELWTHGVVSPLDQQSYFFCPLGVVGDWPFIAKAGCLSRSFYNAAKHAQSTKALKELCHLCQADRPGYPWEDFESVCPPWVTTMNTDYPFLQDPPLLRLPHVEDDPADFFTYDLFHAWHIGDGKAFLGTALILLSMSSIFAGSVETRFRAMTQKFHAWCKKHRYRPRMRKFSRQNLNWATSASYPTGGWSKGHTTRLLNKWFLIMCQRNLEVVRGDRLLDICFHCASNMEFVLKPLYSHELWLPREVAWKIGDSFLTYLKLYGRGASLAHQNGQALFLLLPNKHRLHHIAWDLRSAQSDYVLNPLSVATQPEEDFIGYPSRLSRRVSQRKVIQRTLQRSLIAAHDKYEKAGLFAEGPK